MKTLAKTKGVLCEEPDHFGIRCFSEEAIKRFPELTAELSESAELLHVQMGALAASARSAIGRGDIGFLRRLFAFLDGVLSHPRIHPEIENAATISFLSPKDFDDSTVGREAWQLLPSRLKNLVQQSA